MKNFTLLFVLLSTLNAFSPPPSRLDLSNDVDFQNYVVISAELGSKVQSTKSEKHIELYAQNKLEEKEKLQLVKNLGFSNLNDFKSTIRQLTSSYNLFVHKYSYVLKSKDNKEYLAKAFSKVAKEKNLIKTKQPDCLAVWGAMMASCLITANLLEQQYGVEAGNIYYLGCLSTAFVFLAGCEGIV
jgi:hypothetical protein